MSTTTCNNMSRCRFENQRLIFFTAPDRVHALDNLYVGFFIFINLIGTRRFISWSCFWRYGRRKCTNRRIIENMEVCQWYYLQTCGIYNRNKKSMGAGWSSVRINSSVVFILCNLGMGYSFSSRECGLVQLDLFPIHFFRMVPWRHFNCLYRMVHCQYVPD